MMPATEPAARTRHKLREPSTVRYVPITLADEHPYWTAGALDQAWAVAIVELFLAIAAL